MAGPEGGVKAVEITLATHPEPAAALRPSLTCTTPRTPLTVPPPTVLARVPRLTGDVGTVIANAPAVMVNVAVVGPAEAGAAKPRPSTPVAVASSRREILIASFDPYVRGATRSALSSHWHRHVSRQFAGTFGPKVKRIHQRSSTRLMATTNSAEWES